MGLENNHPYFLFVKEQKELMNNVFLSAYIIETVVLMIFSYIFSHRIAGPIHRMKMWLERISKGEDAGDLSFRKDDFFSELPELANKAVTRLKQSDQQ
ncbi:hypothetical protein [Bdellovibrio bacteriovorus]|nr:hypothetical protein [Bdellovibrio bacteriovorus]